ncbi:ganglioside GM2 activator-like [Scyliorhinus canicula]|uniref:ganglioside GM2 activator-like n=1 Tax=Scyliorhinus canicula TaxID=7830 RepID=UPI0018F3C68A|nr:ganglioside GM2 activator-like [Scyliorhinus canicula]
MALRSSVNLLAICLLYQLRTSNCFSWDDCSAAHEPVTFKEISIGQDPVKLPGTLQYQVSMHLSSPLSSMTAEVTLYKKFLFWWRIPCFDSSICQFDVCELSTSMCPFNSGLISSSGEMKLLRPSMSRILLNGYYSATIILKSFETKVGCANIYFNIRA